MFKKAVAGLMVISMLFGLSACSEKNSAQAYDNTKIQIVVSFNAIREFTEAIGKDKVQIRTMIPEGTEPHDFEPKAKDLEYLHNGKIFVYNGLGMEAWIDKAVEAADNKELIVVDASKGFDTIKNDSPEEIKEHGQYDPHIWLSLRGAENQARNILDALIKADGANKDYYEKNYKDFSGKLEALYNEYYNKFQTVSNKNFVTGHAAFAYLCRDFGLKQNSVEDVFAEGEPSAKKMKELADYCRENKIKTIFTEDLVSAKVSDTLAKEVGAKAEKIYTIESKEDNKDYLQSMKDNLEKIYNSLK